MGGAPSATTSAFNGTGTAHPAAAPHPLLLHPGIGYSTITTLSIKTASSRLRGNTQALFVMTKYNNSRFEFIFTSLVKASPRLFTTVQAVFR